MVREPRPPQCSPKPVPRAVPGENPPRAVATVRRRREADDGKASGTVAEARERLTPVLFAGKSRPLLPCDLLPPRDEAGAAPAGDDLGVQLLPRAQGHGGRLHAQLRPRSCPCSRPEAAHQRAVTARLPVTAISIWPVTASLTEMAGRQKPSPGSLVVLVRHGSTPTTGKEMPEAPPGPPLSEAGVEEAEQAARHLEAWRALWPPLEAIYTSPLRRARETASILAKVLELPVEEMGDLVDTDAGDWAGQDLKRLAKKPEWATVLHNPSSFCFPGGEPLAAMAARSVAAVRAIATKHQGKAAVAVSHADPIKAVLADALGMHLDMFQRVMVSPASVSVVSYSPAGPSVLEANWTVPKKRGTS